MKREKDEYDLRERDDDEFSMERYFEEGLSDGREPNNPFEPEPAKKKHPAKKKGGSKLEALKKNLKLILIVLAVIAAIIIGIIIAVTVSKRKNDGAKFARTIADSIGLTMTSAKQSSKIELTADSAYPAVNATFYMYNDKAESKKTVKLEGSTYPQWLIVCDKDGDNLAGVKFFDFRALDDSVYGEKRNGYLDTKTVQAGAAIEQVEQALDLVPYCTQYLRDGTQQRDYRYFFKDSDTGDTVCYTVSALFNANDVLVNVSEARTNYMAGILLNGIK